MNEAYIGKICPYCKGELTAGDDIVKCSTCDMPHHRDCWVENQGCTTFGCDGTIQSVEPSADKNDFDIEIYNDEGIKPGISPAPAQYGNYEQKNVASFCSKCGNKLEENMRFCPKCGTCVVSKPEQNSYNPIPQQSRLGDYSQFAFASPETMDVQNNKSISVLCYFGLLLLIPLLTRPNSQFVRFHANQGLLCMIAGLVFIVICLIPVIRIIGYIMEIFIFICEILGIINCLNGSKKEIPIIGKYNIIK